MYRIYVCLFISVIFVNLLYVGHANINNIPEYRLCADPSCKAAISEAHGSVSYIKENDFMLSFKRGDKMVIVGKADEKKQYWTAKMGEKIGFVPPELVKEHKVYYEDDKLSHKVPVAKTNDVNNSAPEISSSEVNRIESSMDSSFPNTSEQTSETPASYEVVDGTTINFDMINESEEVKPSSTVPADSNTVTQEPPVSSVPEPVTESTNAETPEDENDDEDDEDDDEEDEGDEEEDVSESEEAVVEAEIKEENKNETVETNEHKTAGEAPNAEQNDDSWGSLLGTVANLLSESQENEADLPSENILKPEENLTEPTEEFKIESSTEAGVNSETEAPTEAPFIPPENTEASFLPADMQNDAVPKENENQTASSLPVEVEDETKIIQLVNDTQEFPNNGLPPVLNEISNEPPEPTSEQNIPPAESYRHEDSSIPPLLRKFESTTEKIVPDYPPLVKPLEPLRTEQLGSNFLPMTEASEVEEVTTESYRKMLSEEAKVVEEEKPAIVVPPKPEASSEALFKPETNFEATPQPEANFDITPKPETGFEEILKPETNFEATPKPETNFEATPKPEILEPIQPTLDENNNEVVNEEPSFFSTLLDTIYGYVGLKQKESSESSTDIVNEAFENDAAKKFEFDKVEERYQAVPEGNCKTIVGLESNCEDAPLAEETTHIWDSWYSRRGNKDADATFYTTLLYLIITAVTVLLFTLGYYFIEGSQKCSPLIAKVNTLEKQLMVSSAECAQLKDELENTKHKLVLYEDSSNNELVISLQAELKEAQRTKSELEATIESLQQELDSATEAGLDLNRMLSEVLTQKGGSDSLMESVERLQAQLDSQQKIIDDMNTSLVMKNQENEGLQLELVSANEKIENLEEELNDIKQNLHILLKEKEDVTSELTTRSNQFHVQIKQLTENKDKEILALKKSSDDLTKQLKELSDSLTLKEGEFNALRESVKKIKTNKNFSVDELLDVTRVRAELAKAEKEKSALKDKLNEEEEARKSLENRVKAADAAVLKLKESYEEAEKEKVEAQTKLEVLSKYFKEKETQLQKELGLQEAMWLQKQGDDSTIYERMTSLQGEIDDYKSQNETLKKEILDQERGLKSQIATLEKKAHENWVAARQAERKLEESKQEASQLRNRLTMIEKNINNELEGKSNHRLNEEINGGEAFSPLMHDASSPMPFPPLPLDPNNPSLLPPGFIPPPPMLIPPHPSMFIPPPPPGGFMPPPPFLPGDRRPPPLGRMSSPPLNNRFSPPSPDYSGDRTSPPPLSPPVRNYRSPNESDRDREQFRHRTPPFPAYSPRDWQDSHSGGVSGFRPISSQRDSRKDHKSSTLSSGHSSSDSLDKSSRHSGRV